MDISNAPNFASILRGRGTATTAGTVVAATSPDEAAISRSNKKKKGWLRSAGAVDKKDCLVDGINLAVI